MMIAIATAKEMKEIDRITIEDWGLPSLALMESAGAAVFKNIQSRFEKLDGSAMLMLCGKGNNGGDGFVLARYLLNTGVALKLLHSHPLVEMSSEAQLNYKLLGKMGFEPELFDANNSHHYLQTNYRLVIDALLGTGLSGVVKGVTAQMIHFCNQRKAPKLSLDIPSGMNADVATIEGPCVEADLTVTIGLPKPSHLFSPSREYVGQLIVEPIGFPRSLTQTPSQYWVNQPSPAWSSTRKPNAHKGQCGRLLIQAGSLGLAGAAMLVAKAAMKSGAAMVQIACSKELSPLYQSALPEAMVLILNDSQDQAYAQIQERCTNWADAFIIGPGLGQNERLNAWVKKLIQGISIPLLIDADGLNALKGHHELLSHRKAATIITPHPGEFRTLFNEEPALTGSPVIAQCRNISKKLNIILHLKGAPSLTALPNGKVMINGTGNPILATAGSGDVLAGIAGSLLAQGLTPEEAMIAAAYYHGACADLIKSTKGMIGHTAMDIANHLPEILNA